MVVRVVLNKVDGLGFYIIFGFFGIGKIVIVSFFENIL